MPFAATLSDVLLTLYRLAQQPDIDRFQSSALALLREQVGFDGAMWAAATLVSGSGRLHHAYTWQLAPDVLELVNGAGEDNLVERTCLASPGVAHVFDRAALQCNAPAAAVAQRLEMDQVLSIVTVDPVSRLMGALTLSRRHATPRFDERDRQWAALLMPHLQEMLGVCRMARLQAVRGQRLAGQERLAIADAGGVLHVAEVGFVELLREEWPDWTGPYLPSPLSGPGCGRPAQGTGEALCWEVEATAGNRVVRLQRRSALDRLSPQERAVALAYAEGRTHKEVARAMGLAPTTVRHHLRRVYAKLGVDDKAALARRLDPS